MKHVKIEAYTFSELSDKAKSNVIYWLDQDPLDYENEDGSMSYQYFYDADECDVEDHCDANGYLFNSYGEPIHHMEVTE